MKTCDISRVLANHAVQASSINCHLKAGDLPTKDQMNTANELLAPALLEKNAPPSFVESPGYEPLVRRCLVTVSIKTGLTASIIL